MSLKSSPLPGSVLAVSILLAVAGCSQAQQPAKTAAQPAAASTAKAGANRPAVLQGIEKHGFEVMGEFDAPGGLRGFAGLVGGQQPAAAYVTADGKNVMVGTLFNEKGEDVGAAPLEKLVEKPMSDKIWNKLDASAWVRDGRADAPRVVYTFSDANCPYCHRFWEAARPWVDSGKVQLRHVMVGVIREDSPAKAAAILGAPNPSAVFLQNEHDFSKGGIKPAAKITPELANKLDANQVLMVELGFQGTPGILFRDAQGIVQRVSGMPQGEDMEKVMGAVR
ncbi:thiol:disulfide interchange protein DsbG [Stenotrophomonas aracearum]|jgi:thiol:disulfide interchange protein DsbG|uniref:Thiol:disulfide interchange protein n=1 Tax=Stenotrophomonas aracearum TaxID=3003272 RepID=A0ABY9Y956_9GAMM|nr:thiol:disulfide interchange protein DsbG [Stenotrophomonas sp. A5588]WNH47235.1 thiol:disulfide interchange protein DsbG [Stenotrophomonas sp. A5588]